MFTIKATSGPSAEGKPITAVSSVPIRLGCNVLPTIKTTAMKATGRLPWEWSMDLVSSDAAVRAKYDQGTPVSYTLSYKRKGSVLDLQLSAAVVLTNPMTKPLRLIKAAWVAEGSTAAAAVTGPLKCPGGVDGWVTIPGSASITCKAEGVLGVVRHKTLTVGVETIDGESAHMAHRHCVCHGTAID